MDPQQALGNPLLVVGVASVTATYALAVAWMTYSIYRVTPELLQVQLFRKMRILQNAVLTMGLALILGMVLVTLFVSNVDLPDAVWGVLAGVAAAIFWYGMYSYSRVFRVPRHPT